MIGRQQPHLLIVAIHCRAHHWPTKILLPCRKTSVGRRDAHRGALIFQPTLQQLLRFFSFSLMQNRARQTQVRLARVRLIPHRRVPMLRGAQEKLSLAALSRFHA